MLAVPMGVSDILCFTHADAPLGNVQVAAVKANAKLDKAVMHCPRGPEDNRNQKGQAVEKSAGQRLKRTGAGLSVRVGCGVRFAARRQPDTPELTNSVLPKGTQRSLQSKQFNMCYHSAST